MAKDRCDCSIGFIHGSNNDRSLTLSNYVSVIKEEADINKDLEVLASKLNIEMNYAKGMDYLDRRKGYSTLHNYCPDCGEKVKWGALKLNLKLRLKIK